MAEAEEMLHFLCCFWLDDGAGDEAVEAGVGGEGDALNRADEDAFGVDQSLELAENSGGIGEDVCRRCRDGCGRGDVLEGWFGSCLHGWIDSSETCGI